MAYREGGTKRGEKEVFFSLHEPAFILLCHSFPVVDTS